MKISELRLWKLNSPKAENVVFNDSEINKEFTDCAPCPTPQTKVQWDFYKGQTWIGKVTGKVSGNGIWQEVKERKKDGEQMFGIQDLLKGNYTTIVGIQVI